MQGYNYVYIDKSGKSKKGQMEAVDEARVIQSLKNEGLIPVSVEKQTALTKRTEINISAPIKPRDLSVFCRQIVSVLGSGVSIVDALMMLGEQTENKRLREAIKDTQVYVEKGESLSASMKQHPKEFPPILINMVEAGEVTGSMENSFERMSMHFEKAAKLKALVKKAMVYPVAVLCVAIAVVILMLVKVIPQFMVMFEGMDIELPDLTKALINASDFLQKQWYLLLGGLAIIIVAIRFYKKTPNGAMVFSKIALKLPLFGKFIVKSSAASFARTLSTLVSSGISMVDAIEITGKTIKNKVFQDAILKSKEGIERGISLSSQIEASGVFPPMVYRMVRIGEETGNIEDMLTKVADYYEEEVEIGTQTLTSAIEPLIIVILACLVGVMIFSIMGPMFTMYDNLDTMYQ